MFLGSCQKCRQPLKVGVNKPLQESSLLAFHTGFPVPGDFTEEARSIHMSAVKMLEESFVVLADEKNKRGSGQLQQLQQLPASSPRSQQSTDLDRKITALTHIFDVASDKCQFEYPMCNECSESVFKELDRRLNEHDGDRELFAKHLQELQQEGAALKDGEDSGEQQQQQQEKEQQEREEAELTARLQRIRAERQALKEEKRLLEEEERTLDAFEKSYWRDSQEQELSREQLYQEQEAMQQNIKVAETKLERMKRTNVFDDAFHISYDGHFGTINGFRLGRLPSQPVEWTETNAALGQVTLLLHTMATKSSFKFAKHTLVPSGSFSKMCKTEDPSTMYELYGSNDLNLGRLFWYRRFDQALVWLLQCIHEFGEFAASQDNRFKQQYPIKGDLIGGVSIKLQFNADPKWTKALKYMLTNLKYLLAWCSKRTD